MPGIGFIGLGIMGQGMAARLVTEGVAGTAERPLVVWNRSLAKCQALVAQLPPGAVVTVAASAADVTRACDVTVSMLSTPAAAAAVFDAAETGTLAGMGPGKALVDCATLAEADMQRMQAAVAAKGGYVLLFGTFLLFGRKKAMAKGILLDKSVDDDDDVHSIVSILVLCCWFTHFVYLVLRYIHFVSLDDFIPSFCHPSNANNTTNFCYQNSRFLEAPVSGSKGPAAQGSLIFLCAGDRALFDEIKDSALAAMGKASHFFGTDVGAGTRAKLVVNSLMGTMLAAFGEGLALAESVGLDPDTMVQVIGQGAIQSPMYNLKGPKMIRQDHAPNFPLKHAHKDMKLACDLAKKAGVEYSVMDTAEALFAKARTAADGQETALADLDFSAVFEQVHADSQSEFSNKRPRLS